MRANEQHESLQNSIGQVFTPSYVAEFMVKNIIKFYNNQKVNSPLPKQISELKVLEPAAGKGVFLDSLLANGFQNITAYELDTGLKKDLTRCYPN
ncbi:MAG: hypothetical protein ACOC44_11425, partial [Promethearchaeia archaeon]